MNPTLPKNYGALLADIKERIRSAQYAALRAVNTELVGLYWDIGRMIVERQKGESWGKSVVERLATDLRAEFPGVNGYSADNLWRMRKLHLQYRENEKLAPLVQQIYLSVLDDKVRLADESPSIGIILCKSKKRVVVEYALREATKPIGVATYKVVKQLPSKLRAELPAPEQIRELMEGVE